MKKTNENTAAAKNANFEIPDSYWHDFVIGSKICDLMHHDAQEGIDILRSVEEGLEEAVEKEKNPQIRQKFESSLAKVKESLAAFREAFYSLRREGF